MNREKSERWDRGWGGEGRGKGQFDKFFRGRNRIEICSGSKVQVDRYDGQKTTRANGAASIDQALLDDCMTVL